MRRFEQKVVLITGAARGIGKGIALCLAEEGADVIVNDLLPTPGSGIADARETVEAVEALGRRALASYADVSDRAQVRAMFASSTAHFGHIDVVVANAALSIREPVIEARWEHVLRTLEVTQFGVFHTCQMAAQQMVAQAAGGRSGGKIIIISSILASIPMVTSAPYNMAKAAIIQFGRTLAAELAGELVVVMRVYFEKPRTTVGWKGLVNDPHLDGSFAVNEGLHLARELLLNVVALGLPAGCEFLDPITPQFIADAVAWGAIGARTTESQVHRNLASGLSMPVGFKNGTGGDIQMAVDAMKAASYPHQFMSVTEQGLAAIVVTRGNRDTHVILRGGSGGPNYDAESVRRAINALEAGGATPRLMIDASHGNSAKDYRRQPIVVRAVAEQVAAGERGIVGMMLESFLVDGRQEVSADMTFGQSVTDACMGWEMTVPTLRELAAAVEARRGSSKSDGVNRD